MKSFPNIQMLLIGAVALALGAAAIPVALGILELGHLRGSIAKIERAVSDVKLARDVIDKLRRALSVLPPSRSNFRRLIAPKS